MCSALQGMIEWRDDITSCAIWEYYRRFDELLQYLVQQILLFVDWHIYASTHGKHAISDTSYLNQVFI